MLKKPVNTEKTTNKIRIPKAIVKEHGRHWILEYDLEKIVLTPIKKEKRN